MRTAASKATFHYSVKCFIHFHHAMKQTEQRSVDHSGASTAQPQNENSLYYPPSQPPLVWLPLSNIHLKEKPAQALQLRSATRLLSHPKSNATIP